MADSILTAETLSSEANSYKKQYFCTMAKYCWFKEGIENPTENQINEKNESIRKTLPI